MGQQAKARAARQSAPAVYQRIPNRVPPFVVGLAAGPGPTPCHLCEELIPVDEPLGVVCRAGLAGPEATAAELDAVTTFYHAPCLTALGLMTTRMVAEESPDLLNQMRECLAVDKLPTGPHAARRRAPRTPAGRG